MSEKIPKVMFEDELKAEKLARIALEVKIKDLTTQLSQERHKRYRAEGKTDIESTLKTENLQSKPEAPPKEENLQSKSLEEPKIGHIAVDTDPFCATCGTINDKFKNETRCVNCKGPMGAKTTVKEKKVCPHCGASGKIVEDRPASIPLSRVYE